MSAWTSPARTVRSTPFRISAPSTDTRRPCTSNSGASNRGSPTSRLYYHYARRRNMSCAYGSSLIAHRCPGGDPNPAGRFVARLIAHRCTPTLAVDGGRPLEPCRRGGIARLARRDGQPRRRLFVLHLRAFG